MLSNTAESWSARAHTKERFFSSTYIFWTAAGVQEQGMYEGPIHAMWTHAQLLRFRQYLLNELYRGYFAFQQEITNNQPDWKEGADTHRSTHMPHTHMPHRTIAFKANAQSVPALLTTVSRHSNFRV